MAGNGEIPSDLLKATKAEKRITSVRKQGWQFGSFAQSCIAPAEPDEKLVFKIDSTKTRPVVFAPPLAVSDFHIWRTHDELTVTGRVGFIVTAIT